MKKDERRQAIKQQREQLIKELEAVYLAAFDRLGELEGEVGSMWRMAKSGVGSMRAGVPRPIKNCC